MTSHSKRATSPATERDDGANSGANGLSRADANTIERDAARHRWLRNLQCNSLHLERNAGHACNYMTAAEWIDSENEDFMHCSADDVEAMKATNTIWALQIYPDTPIGFYRWFGPTAESVIDAAIAAYANTEATRQHVAESTDADMASGIADRMNRE
jgi:hypothetical protein